MPHAANSAPTIAEGPKVIAWEITRNCPWHCAHCRIEAAAGEPEPEMTTAEARKFLENLASKYRPLVILTGGEPLVREDLWELAALAAEKGLRLALATCGKLLTPELAEKMKTAGIRMVSLSLHGSKPAIHESLTRVPGSYDSTLKAAEILKAAGLAFQINSTITKLNRDDLENLLNTAVKLSASAFHPFLLVPTGKGRLLRDLSLSKEEYETALNRMADLAQASDFPLRPTCAPQYWRILSRRGVKLHFPSGGCTAGKSFCFVSSSGKLKPCGFFDLEGGDLRTADFNFAELWENSPLFNQLRDLGNYPGKCGSCSFAALCGGCRARALELNGGYLEDEPFCPYAG